MKRQVNLIIIAVVVFLFTACQPRLDCTNEETLNNSVEEIMASLDSTEQKKFAEAMFVVEILDGEFVLSLINNSISEAFGDSTKEVIDSLIFKELHGMTYADVVELADKLKAENDKQQIEKLYEKKAKQAEFDQVGCKLILTPTKIYKKDSGVSGWLYFDYDFENNYDFDIGNVRYLEQYIHGNDTITDSNFLNLTFKKGESGSKETFFSARGKGLENVENPELSNFTFKAIAIYSGSSVDEENTAYNEEYFTEKDEKRLQKLLEKHPELAQKQ